VKYKNVASALHNFADSFTSDSNVVMHDVTMAYLARRAIQGAGTVLRFDVLKGTAAPAELVAEPVSTSVRAYAAWFPRLLKSHNVAPDALAQAVLELRFQVERVSVSIGFPNSSEMPIDCVITASDDRGREHVVSFTRWLTFYDSDPDQRDRTLLSAMR
jgi:hypothetical protein